MGRRKEGDRVLGPYEEGGRYRVLLIVGGRKEAHTFEGAAEAETYAADARAALQQKETLTVREAIAAYQEATRPSLKPETVLTQERRLRGFFEGTEEEPLSALAKKGRAAQLYAALAGRLCRKAREPRPVSAAYHRSALKAARRFLTWCVAQRYLASNPLADVKGVGRVRKRKAQHRLSESQRFYDTALELAQTGGPPHRVGALATLTALLLTLRQSEVTSRQVRDLDNGGKWLVIDDGKTENSKGTLEVPGDIRPLLLELARGRPAEAPLFWYEGRSRSFGKNWLVRWTKKICALAGVPPIVAHALRGQGSSIGATQGVLPHVISDALRHGNQKVTRDHYIDPAALAAAERGRLAELLRGGGAPELADLVGRLAALAEQWRGQGGGEQADQLLAVLQQRGNHSRNVPGAKDEARN